MLFSPNLRFKPLFPTEYKFIYLEKKNANLGCFYPKQENRGAFRNVPRLIMSNYLKGNTNIGIPGTFCNIPGATNQIQ